MTTLSVDAKLSMHYTNHCVRATVITLLDNSGYEAWHIMAVSGHKNIDSIQSYSTRTSNSKKREMAESLAGALLKSPKKTCLDKENIDSVDNTKHNENTNVNMENMSFRELLELDEEQEQALLKEILSDDVSTFEPNASGNKNQVAFNATSNVTNTVNPIAMHNVLPKMLFNNSNITINFNINK